MKSSGLSNALTLGGIGLGLVGVLGVKRHSSDRKKEGQFLFLSALGLLAFTGGWLTSGKKEGIEKAAASTIPLEPGKYRFTFQATTSYGSPAPVGGEFSALTTELSKSFPNSILTVSPNDPSVFMMVAQVPVKLDFPASLPTPNNNRIVLRSVQAVSEVS